MNNIQKRFLLFIFGCISIRIILVLIAAAYNTHVLLPIMGYVSLIPAMGFIYIYITNTRKTGSEVFGEKIWWNTLRPIHALLYFIFACLAINKNKYAWIILLIDVIIGLSSFLYFHYTSNNFKYLFQH